MTSNRMFRVAVVVAGAALLGATPGRAAGPPAALPDSEAGAWRLIPLADSHVPAAWVINTRNGDTYLCGTGALDGHVRVACVEANFPRPNAK